MSAKELAQFILGLGIASFAALAIMIGITVVGGAYCQP